MAGTHKARYTNWSIQLSYIYFISDANGNVVKNMSENQWKDYIRELIQQLVTNGTVDTVSWIFHDKDVDKDGNPKGLHVHMIVNVKGGKEQTAMMTMFGSTRSQDVKNVKKKSSAYQYLIHVTQTALKEKKHIYNFSEIECLSKDANFNLMKQFYPTKKDNADEENLRDICHGKVMTGELTVKEVRSVYLHTDGIGTSAWVKERRSYEADEKEWMQGCNDWYSTNNACKTTIFITGGGGAQKTDLAQMIMAPHFADKRGVHVPAAPMGRVTYDPIGTYHGERVTVLNEIKGSSWILEGFCECLDPTHSGSTGSRYFDKPFFPSYVLMTTSTDVEQFIEDMFLKWVNVGRHDNNQYYVSREMIPFGNGKKPQICLRTNGVIPEYVSYDTDTTSIWNKVWQVRRRIPIIVRLHDKIASIDVLDYSKETYLFGDDAAGCYVHFTDIPYSLTDDKVIKDFLDAIDAAIKYYYIAVNKFTINPNTVKKPLIML